MRTNVWPWGREEASSTVTSSITKILPRKRYIQLKETHIAKAGMIWEDGTNVSYQYSPVTLELMKVTEPGQWREPQRPIENNPEWFEELLPVYVNREMMAKIGVLTLNKGN